MSPERRFGVVIFSGRAVVYRSVLARGTEEEKARAIAWLRKHNPATNSGIAGGGTNAASGLASAFLLQPQEIFFVSDGEPDQSTDALLRYVQGEQRMRARSGAGFTVHSIAYLASGGQAFMRALAEQNQGSFREVNPEPATAVAAPEPAPVPVPAATPEMAAPPPPPAP